MKPEKPLKIWALVALVCILAACGDEQSGAGLPYHGFHTTASKTLENGKTIIDTVYYTIPKFSFTNQDNEETSHYNYRGKVFVADFFFTTCPTICPIMSSQMARLQTMVEQERLSKDVAFLSHSIDPLNDSPEVLKAYADRMGANTSNWNFVTGEPKDIYDHARSGYMITALEADTAPGGYIHSDNFVLIDQNMHIRGYYDGTSTAEGDQLLQDLKILLNEHN